MINLYQILIVTMLALLIGAKVYAGEHLNVDDFVMAAFGFWMLWRFRGKSKVTIPPLWFWVLWIVGGLGFLYLVLKWKSELLQ